MITNEQIKAFNQAKINLQYVNSFTKDELLNAIKKCGISVNQYLIGVLLDNDVISKVPCCRSKGEKQLYTFVSKDPIYVGYLENWIKKAKELKNRKQKEWWDRKQQNSEIKVLGTSNEVEKAIALLKSKGYKILKPNITFEEIQKVVLNGLLSL